MPASDAERIAAAQAYIDALVGHDADKVPFAPGCTRIEVGLKTGLSRPRRCQSSPWTATPSGHGSIW
jgi:hypothetical protein